MKQSTLKTLALSFFIEMGWVGALAQVNNTEMAMPDFGDHCTSILVGKNATTDGSVITSHTCDSWYRTWMQWIPSVEYKNDTLVEVYSGKMHTEYPGSMDGVKVKGKVAQKAGRTYRVLDTAYPCLNSEQLAMGETTFSGKDTLRNKDGMFMIEELSRIALQRCTKAREAILMMGELVYEYGYGDGGECLTIADTEEAWIFEILGEGPNKIGAVWAACRIPADEVCVSANISRIGSLSPLKEPVMRKSKKKAAYAPLQSENVMASQNVFSVARELKLWDGEGEFSFWRAYSGKNFFGKMQNYANRELFIMQQLAPSLGLNADMDELPLSVRPEKKVSVEDVSRLLGSYFEGTEQDLTQLQRIPSTSRKLFSTEKWESKDSVVSNFANPWMRFDEISTYYAMTGDERFQWVRTIAVPQCAYSTVIQVRGDKPNAIGGVCWMSLDNPGQSPRFPIFAGGTELPSVLKICGQHRYREDCLLWHYRQANKLAAVRWGICRKTLEPARDYFLHKGLRELPMVEAEYTKLMQTSEKEATELLNGYTADFVGATMLRWDELYRSYWRKFWAGF
ncbi:MAG: C69 family dipeptidase [Paludibacteraceae bacterium]|nr:C69 family dipeptidase [Paludibacteraceae bacterium]